MSKQLTGQALADAVAKRYREELQAVALPERANDGQLWATYNGGGWIELNGRSLPPNKDIKQYEGLSWTLGATHRSSYWREWLDKPVGE